MGSYRYEILRETTTDSLIMENNTREKKMNSNVYGIDLGTCNMKIYCKTSNKILNEKNTIALVKKDQIYAYGDAAYAMYEKAPENIEREYVITADIDGYMRNTFYNNDGCMIEEYKDGDIQIIFSQMTFSHFNGTRINTETVEDAITAVDVNGITALYFENGKENMLVWNNDEYVFSFQTNKLGKDELIALSESVKPKQ